MGLGEIYEEKGLYKDAIAEYKKVIEVDAKHTAAHYNLAMAYEKLDPREAIAQWDRYIGIASTDRHGEGVGGRRPAAPQEASRQVPAVRRAGQGTACPEGS